MCFYFSFDYENEGTAMIDHGSCNGEFDFPVLICILLQDCTNVLQLFTSPQEYMHAWDLKVK
jgi:hypothetical protein